MSVNRWQVIDPKATCLDQISSCSFGTGSSRHSALPAASFSFAISPYMSCFLSSLSSPPSPSSLTPKSFSFGKITHLSPLLPLPLPSFPDHPDPRTFPASHFFNLLLFRFCEEALICSSSDMSEWDVRANKGSPHKASVHYTLCDVA